MATTPMNRVIQHLVAACGRDGMTDGELLTRFLSGRDEDALAALIGRHGPMVWGVCCRVLRHPHDAEDAFQATFLILVQKAATLPNRETVGNWLHGVARQTAVRMRALAAKRGLREKQVAVMPEPTTAEQYVWNDLSPVVDEELSRLPNKYRALIVLCDLEGVTRKEVARRLDIPEGTAASRLAAARAMLAKRLARRGIVLSGVLLGNVLCQPSAGASVPALVVSNTRTVASLMAAGKAAGVISGPVATLTHGVLKTMFLKKILTTTMAVLALGVAVLTGESLAVGQTEGKPAVGKDVKAPVAEKPVAPAAKQEKANQEPEVAWGKEVDGLQLGLVLVPADKTAFRPGETMEFTVKVRNVSKEKITLRYGRPESTPTITDATGENVRVAMPPFLDIYVPVTDKALRPGETVDLYNRTVAVEEVRTREDEQKGFVRTPTIRVGAGKYKIAFPEFVTQNLVRSTGEVEFEVKDGDEKKLPEQKLPKQKEAFTAWGKEVGGLQAGLGFKAGEQRVHTHGETVTLVLRVRNVGKEEVKFSYYHDEFLGSPPTVTDDGGQHVPLVGVHRLGIPVRIDVTLAPGKTVDLTEANLALRPVGDKGEKTPAWTLFGTGKYQLQCEKAGGSIRDQSAPEPVLSKLATGKLELEVKEPQDKKEAFTAWGKEVGGLQAGFCITNANDINIGGKVQAVVKLRNVSKETIKVSAWPLWAGHYPGVVDARGNRVRTTTPPEVDFIVIPNPLTLKSGETVVVEKTEIRVAALKEQVVVPEGVVDMLTIHVEPGKFKTDCVGFLKEHPALGTGTVEFEVNMPKAHTPEEAIRMANDSELRKTFNATKPTVEFKVEFVTKAILVKASGEKEAAWAHGHSPDDVCLGLLVPNTPGAAIDLVKRDHVRFVATLTAKVIGQLNKVGITDLEKHFKGKTVRVTGLLSRHEYDGEGSAAEVEIVLDDVSQIEVVK